MGASLCNKSFCSVRIQGKMLGYCIVSTEASRAKMQSVQAQTPVLGESETIPQDTDDEEFFEAEEEIGLDMAVDEPSSPSSAGDDTIPGMALPKCSASISRSWTLRQILPYQSMLPASSRLRISHGLIATCHEAGCHKDRMVLEWRLQACMIHVQARLKANWPANLYNIWSSHCQVHHPKVMPAM